MGHCTGAINALFTFILLGRAAGVMCVRIHVHITARGTLSPLLCLRGRWEGAHGTHQALSGQAARAGLLSGTAVSLPRETPPLQDIIHMAWRLVRPPPGIMPLWGLRVGWPLGDGLTPSRVACCTLVSRGWMLSFFPSRHSAPKATCLAPARGGREKRPRAVRLLPHLRPTDQTMSHSPGYTSTPYLPSLSPP